MSLNYKNEHYVKAKRLIGISNVYAISLIEVFESQFPEFTEIRNSELFPVWDYCIAIASVGVAFTLIADAFPDNEIDSISNAVFKAVGEWEKDPYNYGNINTLNNFIDTFNTIVKETHLYDLAIGTWVMTQLNGSSKATPKLKEIAHNEKYASLIGKHIISSFKNIWKDI